MFKIITMQNCRYCDTAKIALTTRGIEFEEVPVTPELKAELVGLGMTTLPQIFENGEHVGGCMELLALLNDRDE